jgi:caffeoyl-CoA O-methyltransferase
MFEIVRPEIEAYAEAHTSPPPPHLEALAAETTEKLDFPQMMVGPLEGRFLEMLVFARQPQRVLEIGTFSGYSALSMAAALPTGGHITTLDISERHAEVARRHIAASPYASSITVVLGPALDSLAHGRLEGPWDFVFIDADKGNYANYYDAVLAELAPGGLIAVDNVLWSGRVVDHPDEEGDTAAIRAFNDKVRADPRVVCTLVTVRDGVLLIRKA